jgi:hypothetical protein
LIAGSAFLSMVDESRGFIAPVGVSVGLFTVLFEDCSAFTPTPDADNSCFNFLSEAKFAGIK